jgi:hypothetical protein
MARNPILHEADWWRRIPATVMRILYRSCTASTVNAVIEQSLRPRAIVNSIVSRRRMNEQVLLFASLPLDLVNQLIRTVFAFIPHRRSAHPAKHAKSRTVPFVRDGKCALAKADCSCGRDSRMGGAAEWGVGFCKVVASRECRSSMPGQKLDDGHGPASKPIVSHRLRSGPHRS